MKQFSPVDILLKGSQLQGRSTSSLGWKGVVVEQRSAPPHERSEEVLGWHYMLLWCGSPTITSRAYRAGRYTRLVKLPGTISLGSAGDLPAVRASTAYNVIACTVDPILADRVALEQGSSGNTDLREHLGIEDSALASLLRLSIQEAERGGKTGTLYSESIRTAIVSRFVAVAATKAMAPFEQFPLPHSSLRRVLDRMAAELDQDIGLSELAAESGYCRSHFLRMFRSATGKPPHRYLQELRLNRAKELISSTNMPLVEVAVSCGFSSHSHLTRMFKQRFGINPRDLRRIKSHDPANMRFS